MPWNRPNISHYSSQEVTMNRFIDVTNERLKDPKYRKLLAKNLPADKFLKAAEYIQYKTDREQLLDLKRRHHRYKQIFIVILSALCIGFVATKILLTLLP